MNVDNSKEIHKRRPATHGGQDKAKEQVVLSRRAKTHWFSFSVFLAKKLLFVMPFAYLMVSSLITFNLADPAVDLSSVKGIDTHRINDIQQTQQPLSQSFTSSTEVAREQSSQTPTDTKTATESLRASRLDSKQKQAGVQNGNSKKSTMINLDNGEGSSKRKREELSPGSTKSSSTIDAGEKSDLSSSETPTILIVTANHHYYGPRYESKQENCTYHGKLMDCEFSKEGKEKADVLLYHMPNAPLVLNRMYPDQLLAGISMEPGSYYRKQMDPKFLGQFDIRMYYNRTSEVPLPHSNDFLANNGLFNPIKVKTADKIPSLVYINSNCGAKNGRNGIVKDVMDIGDIEVHSYGTCLRNKDGGGRNTNKMDIMSKYRFCIAMENSNEIDYVSEKLWQALQAGCLPVYYGAPNIAEFLPVPINKIIINYADFGSPKALSDELVRINNDVKLYEEFMEWKKLDPRKDKVLPGFKWLVEVADRGHSRCELCRYAMKVKEGRKNKGVTNNA